METKEMIKSETKELTQKDIDVLIAANVLPKNIPDEMIRFFLAFCKQTNLNPFKRQVYIVPRYSKAKGMNTYMIQTGIDGYRAIADRTGLYAGSDDAVFDDEINPRKATVTVYKMINGQRCSFSASARMSEYKPLPSNDTMWNKMPTTMLAKCAESLALRKAFPNELSGTYTDEEMQQADTQSMGVVSPIKIEKPKDSGSNPAPSNSCVDCHTEIKQNVLNHSMQEFGEPVCFHCQIERRKKKDIAEGKKEADEQFHVSEFEEVI